MIKTIRGKGGIFRKAHDTIWAKTSKGFKSNRRYRFRYSNVKAHINH